MAVDTDEVRDIVDFAPEGFLVTSFYLNVDATEFPDPDHIHTSANSLLSTARERFESLKETLSHDAAESVRADLDRIETWVKEDFERTDTNGLAVFVCSAQDFWQVYTMHTPVQSRVEFGPHAYVAPIATFLSHSRGTAILLTDRENARILTMKHGDVREWASFDDFVPQRTSQGGWSQNRYQRRSDNFARHHIDRGTELVLKLLQHYPFEWLILGADEDALPRVQNDLHPYVKDRVIGTIHVRLDASVAEVVEHAREVREQAEREHIDQLVTEIQEYAGADGRGTIGLEDTVAGVNAQKVHILLVQDGYSHPGAECPSCRMLFTDQQETCQVCGETTHPVDNVVDSAIQRSLELGSVVEVATEYNKLESIQNIGSIMYY